MKPREGKEALSFEGYREICKFVMSNILLISFYF